MARPAWVLGGFQIIKQVPHVGVELLDHGAVKRIGLALAGPCPRVLWIYFDPQFLAVLVQQRLAAGVDRRVHQPGRVVEEKWLGFLLLDKLQCIQAILVSGDAILIQTIRVVLFIAGKPRDPIGRHLASRAQIGARPVKALVLGLRKGVMVKCHMPLTTMAGDVTVFLQ